MNSTTKGSAPIKTYFSVFWRTTFPVLSILVLCRRKKMKDSSLERTSLYLHRLIVTLNLVLRQPSENVQYGLHRVNSGRRIIVIKLEQSGLVESRAIAL